MNEKVFKIFVDFDGTITTRDVGEAFMYHFGDQVEIKKILDNWIAGKISSPDSWYLMVKTISDFTQTKFDHFLSEFEIDSTFPGFINYCKENDFEMRVVSDGFDLYINKIFEKARITGLEVYCNRFELTQEGKLFPVFPYSDEECKQCGNCKRNHILSNSGDDDYIIYIGDGYSDKCPIQYCDFIFAKRDLLKYCELNRITYYPFNNFDDVIKKLDELKSKKRLKKRHQAELKRKEVFLQG